MAEQFDIFDAHLNPVAPYKIDRDIVHAEGLWHQVFHCWIMRREGDDAKMLLQLRGKDKKDAPNTLDISAAGHLAAGEKPIEGLRELEEELGIVVAPEKLLSLGAWKQVSERPGFLNREFCHTYFHETTATLADYRPQLIEVDGLFEISVADGLKLFSREIDQVTANGIFKDGTVYKPTQRIIRLEDMCNARDRCEVTSYYLKVFILAALYLKGHRPLAI